jgi:hypothetical protein
VPRKRPPKADPAGDSLALPFIACTVRELPADQLADAARVAVDENPANAPRMAHMAALLSSGVSEPEALAVLTSKYFGQGGVRLGVAFLDGPAADLRARILAHMNAWGATANVTFTEASAGLAQVRIARQRGGGYWSYLGTDVLQIPRGEPTMNLDSFTMSTSEAEYRRVVRHETGHTLGFPHEHLRREVIGRLDRKKTVAYFRQTYGWSESMTVSNVLTPLEDRSIMGTPQADEDSIMAYMLPGSITTDGRPVAGGGDINALDASFCGKLYPPPAPPPPPPPPPPPAGSLELLVPQVLQAGKYRLARVE